MRGRVGSGRGKGRIGHRRRRWGAVSARVEGREGLGEAKEVGAVSSRVAGNPKLPTAKGEIGEKRREGEGEEREDRGRKER